MQVDSELGGFLAAGVLAITAVIAGVAGHKAWQVHQARDWLVVPGRVVSSRKVVRKVARMRDEDDAKDKGYEMRNFAEVRFEFEHNGRKLRGERVSLGEDPGNFEVDERLALYPVGREVTVYFDPARPEGAVLERDAPAGMFRIVAGLVVGGLVLAWLLAFGAGVFTGLTRRFAPEPGNVQGALLCAAAAAIVGGAALLMRRRAGVALVLVLASAVLAFVALRTARWL